MLTSIRKRLRSFVRDERGVALTEFALVAPLLFVVLFATIDFGKGINYWNEQTQMAAQGARLAAVNGTNAYSGACVGSGTAATLANYIQCQAATNELRNGGGSTTKSAVCIVPSGGGAAGNPITVRVRTQYTWLPLYSIIRLHLGTTTIQGQATMRLERPWTAGTVGSTGATCP
jgi:Flp pilus assembly protein TadG